MKKLRIVLVVLDSMLPEEAGVRLRGRKNQLEY